MADLRPDYGYDEADVLDIAVPDAGTEDAQLVNTRGASLNYVRWTTTARGAFCADKSSLKGTE
ncbi:hypothetical protein [Actinophytocola oryzae]|uniref:Uncharacterized protein n=1 Tax=Actinophytocola oryzae TaxID=502181 RepID=A0A4R7W423_9PSEU|nr:hypothetical protein [Actinophytocola oryzae]TDV57433.1 hypothetical protein CLV71_101304 [Actinophytocola oryzae]